MKKIFCLFIVVFAMAQMLNAQPERVVRNVAPLSVQDASSSDAPVTPVSLDRNVIKPKSPLALSGTYEIGVGKTYDKLSTAVNDLVLQGVSGPVTFEFTDANYTDTSIVISAFAGQGAANPVVFQLKSGNLSARIFFTGGLTTRTWGIRFDSTQYVSFIGSSTVGSYPITFEVDTTLGNPIRNPFQIIRSDNIRLEGLKIIGHRRWSDRSAGSAVWQTSFVGSTLPNTNNTYRNLWILRCSVPFNAIGISPAIRDNNITLSYSDFGGPSFIETFSARGLNLGYSDNMTIYMNDIRRGKNFSNATSGPVGLIEFGAMNNLIVSHNKLHDMEKVGTLAGVATGMQFQTSSGTTPTGPIVAKVFNNMIYDLRNPAGVNPSATQAVEGIRFTSLSPNAYTMDVYNNTIHLTGSLSATTPSWCGTMVISSAVANDLVNIYNNVLSNEIKTGGLNSGTFIYGDFVFSAAISDKVKGNRNLFWYPHFPVYWSALAIFGGGDLNSWQAATGEDASSIEQSNPFFLSATDPHIVASSLSAAEGNASVVGFVTDDIDGQPRSGSTPDLGADEFSGNMYTLALQALVQGFYSDGNFDNNLYGTMVSDTVKVELRNAASPYGLVTSATGVLDSSGYGMFQLGSWTAGNSYYIVVKHRNSIETWSRGTGELLNLTAANYSFVDTAKAFGDNQVKKGVYWCIYSGDVNQDGVVDLTDVSTVDTDNLNFVSGYVVTDVNGDQLVDLSDLSLVDTNNLNFVAKVVPSKLLLRNNSLNRKL